MRIFPGNIFLPTQSFPQIRASCHRAPSLSLPGGQLLTAKKKKDEAEKVIPLLPCGPTFWSFNHENLDFSVTLTCSSWALQGLSVFIKENGPYLL